MSVIDVNVVENVVIKRDNIEGSFDKFKYVLSKRNVIVIYIELMFKN